MDELSGYLLCGIGSLALWIINDTRVWLKSISAELKDHIQNRELHTHCNKEHN